MRLSIESLLSPTTQLPPMIALAPINSASWASCSHRFGLHRSLAGSPVSMAESSSLYYGRLSRLSLLSTSPRNDAVTISYRPVGKPGKDLHLPVQTPSRAHYGRALCPPLVRRTPADGRPQRR